MDLALFGRYFLEFAMMYPGAFLCLASLQDHLCSPRKSYALAAVSLTVICLTASLLSCISERESNFLLLPLLIVAFWLLRWRAAPEIAVSQAAFIFAVAMVMMAVCTLLAAILNARAEIGNSLPVNLVSTSCIALLLAAVLSTVFYFTAVQWSRWLLKEYCGEAFWKTAWPLPALYAAFLVFCIPKDSTIILMNRLQIISVLAVLISLIGIFLLQYEMYRVAREYTRNIQLNQENQLLALESRRYTELRAYMDNTRRLRHDFRQHLHVIAGLTEAEKLEELKDYLSQYETELIDRRSTLCANAAVDALAGHYDYEARQNGVTVEWKLELPKLLVMPEADLCMILGNLLENALHACKKLPPDQRRVKVLVQMLSPAMMGLVVENRYDGVLKRQNGILHSTKHEGAGVGLASIETAVHRYHGSMTIETGNNVFRVNILMNL